MGERGVGDREQILELLAEAAWIFDHKQWARIGEVFTADAVAYGCRGLEAIRANTVRYLGTCGPTQHLIGTHRVRTGADSATVTSHVRAFHLDAGAEPMGRVTAEQFWDFVGEYTDELRRTPDGWRIVSRVCRPIAGAGSLTLGVRADPQ